jgi:uncharacterized protein (DUF1697 family)
VARDTFGGAAADVQPHPFDVPRQIALLRGINLANRRRVAMPALRELLEGLGYGPVQTHLQSGNVVITSGLAAAKLERKLEQQLREGLGFDVDVLVRSRAELAKVVALDPFGDVADKPSWYLVNFLSAKPAAKVVRELEGEDVAPEQFVVSGREIYSWHPKGVQRSKLSKLLSEKRLGVSITNRNWNTVTKLLALADESAG